MSDVDPGSPETPPPDPSTPVTPQPPEDPSKAAPPRKGLSTGAKVAIGCGVVALLVIIALVVAGLAGGIFLKRKADQLQGGVEAQTEASETIRELEAEHAFSPPRDGIVGEDRAARFFDVTDDAWEEIEEEAGDLARRGADIERRGGDAGVGDAIAGFRGLHRARVALAEALEDHDMPVSEYLWTGFTLMRAYGELDRPASESGVPPENLDLAAGHRAELAEIEQTRDDEGGKGMVLGLAVTWAMSEGNLRALGLDTLMMR